MKIPSTIVAFLLSAAVLNAGWPVTVIGNAYDAMVKEPLDAKRWADALVKANEQLNEMKRVYSQAQTIAAFIGDGKVSVHDLHNIAGIANSIGNIAGPDTTFAGSMREMAQKGQDLSDLFDAGSELAWNVNDTMQIGDRKYRRDVSLYQALRAAENLAITTRGYLEEAAKRDSTSQQRIDRALQDLMSKPNPTQTDIQAALVKLQREHLAQQSEIHRVQLLLAQQEQERLAQQAQAQAITTTETEAQMAADKLAREQAEQARRADVQRVRDNLMKAEPEPEINSSAIKVWLPEDKQ